MEKILSQLKIYKSKFYCSYIHMNTHSDWFILDQFFPNGHIVELIFKAFHLETASQFTK